MYGYSAALLRGSSLFRKLKNPLILFLVIFASWGLYRYLFRLPEWIDEFIAKPIIMLLPVFFVVRTKEKKKFATRGISGEHIVRNLLIGLGVGVFLIAEALVVNRPKGNLLGLVQNILPVRLFFLGERSDSQPVLLRKLYLGGYFLQRFLGVLRNEFFANLLSTARFVIVHFSLLILTTDSLYSRTFLTSLIQLSTPGAFNGILFARTKTIVASTMSHAIWNAAAVLL